MFGDFELKWDGDETLFDDLGRIYYETCHGQV